MVGVSPAYFISRFGEGFTPENIATSLPDITEIGGEGYQLELYRETGAVEWTGKTIDRIKKAEDRTGARATQFVAHYFLHGFGDPISLRSDRGLPVFSRVVEICASFPTVSVITIPIPPFDAGTAVEPGEWKQLRTAFREKLKRACGMAGDRGFKIALELVPGNLLGSPEMILALRKESGLEAIGFTFDTGHAWACRECVDLIPAKLEGAIYGTHLKDNTQEAPLALAPGAGTISWERLVGGLLAADYAGSWDVEFLCSAAEVQGAYRQGIRHIKEILRACGAFAGSINK